MVQECGEVPRSEWIWERQETAKQCGILKILEILETLKIKLKKTKKTKKVQVEEGRKRDDLRWRGADGVIWLYLGTYSAVFLHSYIVHNYN